MTFTLERLLCDVCALLGESSLQPQSDGGTEIPAPGEILGRMVTVLLPRVGSRLIREALPEQLCGGETVEVQMHTKVARCGLYSADIPLPAGFLRLVSVRMGEWKREVCRIFGPGDQEWSRQWSEEPGIAGCPQSPHAYLSHYGEGAVLRLIGSEEAGDSPLWFRCCFVPLPDEEGVFTFPAALYGELVEAITANIR